MSILAQLIGQTLDEKYQIEKQLGQGGMGAVFLATHIGTGRPVAVKVISPQFMANEEFVERFKREAQAVGLLRHPNVVNVTDFGFTNVGRQRIAYMVMEYLDGGSLADFLKQRSKLPLSFVVDIVEQVCLALDAAHAQGIIHRDLKPDNIWLQPTGRGGYNVKVLDFGLAKLNRPFPVMPAGEAVASASVPTLKVESGISIEVDREAATLVKDSGEKRRDSITPSASSELTNIGTIMGTPLYMSPEQCRGERSDELSDIYSLGVIAYEMLTGETPFRGEPLQLISKHNDEQAPPVTEKRRDISSSVASLIMSALAKNPLARPVSARAFAAMLRTSAEGEIPIFNQAFEFYARHRSNFVYPRIIIYSPIFVLLYYATKSSMTMFLMALPTVLLAEVANNVAAIFITERLRQAPHEPVPPRDVCAVVISRTVLLLATLMRHSLAALPGKLNRLPGRFLVDLTLIAPIVIIEKIEGEAALLRLSRLVELLRSVAVAMQLHRLLVNLTGLALAILFGLFLMEIFFVDYLRIMVLAILFVVLIMGFNTAPYDVAASLFYWKVREAAGEANTSNMEAVEMAAAARGRYRQSLFFFSAQVAKRITLVAGATILMIFCLGIFLGVTGRDKQVQELLAAANSGRTDRVRELIAAGVDVNRSSLTGSTALMAAAIGGYSDTVKVLIAAGADINVKQLPGEETVLMEAASAGRTEVVALLIAAGADVNARNRLGQTALQIAQENGRSEIASMLKTAGARE